MSLKLLIITYYWPPGASPGVQRFVKFTKYLNQAAHQIDVLTVMNGTFPSRDESLLAEIPKEVNVYRTKTIEPFAIYNLLRGKKRKETQVGMPEMKASKGVFSRMVNYIRANFFIPDARIGWNRFALKRAIKLCNNRDYDAIISTGPPHSSHLIALALKEKFDIPWIADFRDPWTSIYYNAYLKKTPSTLKKDKALEKKVVQSCDHLVVVTPGMRSEFAYKAPNLSIIYNGFDSSDFPDITYSRSAHFSIRYIGNFKSNQSIPILWEAIAELCKENADISKHLRLDFTGNIHKDIEAEIKQSGLSDRLRLNDFVPHAEAIELMRQSSILLLPIPQSSNNKLLITGKIFEYLASKKPILSVGPLGGDADIILKSAKREGMIDYQEKQAMKDFVLTHFNLWLNKETTAYSDDHYAFSRSGMAKKLEHVIHSLKK